MRQELFPAPNYCTTHIRRGNPCRWNFLLYNPGMERTGPGRPPKPPDERLAARIDVRADGADRQAFERAAEKAGLKLSDWIRDRLRAAAKRELGKSAR